MKISFIPGNNYNKSMQLCFEYLKEKYLKEKVKDIDCNLRQGEYRGSGKERIQSDGSGKGLQEAGRD